MIFQNSFRRFIARIQGTPSDGALAIVAAAFEAGENAVLGERDLPALLKAQANPTFVAVESKPILTQAQINYLLKVTAALATQFQENNAESKLFEQFAWKHSDKDTEIGKLAFAKLNEVRNARRKLKAHRERLNGIIVALKKAR